MFTYGLEGCTRTYNEQTTYANNNGVSNTVITGMNLIESDISEAICCEQSDDSPDDPLIEACLSDEPETVVSFTFEQTDSGDCSSTTTTTTVYYDVNGDEKAIR